MHPALPLDNICGPCGRLMPSYACAPPHSGGNQNASESPGSAPVPPYYPAGPSLRISPAAATRDLPPPPQPAPIPPRPPESPSPPTASDNACFWPRVIAYLIDSCVLGLFLSLYLTAGIVFGDASLGTSSPDTAEFFLALLFATSVPVLIIARIIYFTLMHGALGTTIGKDALGLRIVYTDGSPITYGAAFWRIITRVVLFSLTGYLFYLSVPISAECRGWHDHIAGTSVIHID